LEFARFGERELLATKFTDLKIRLTSTSPSGEEGHSSFGLRSIFPEFQISGVPDVSPFN
jgi:hypothetical protein